MTQRQKKLLDFIKIYMEEHGIAPSFEEMREFMGGKSKSGIFFMLRSLEERGLIRRLPHRSRAIELVKPEDRKLPENLNIFLTYLAYKGLQEDFGRFCETISPSNEEAA